MNRSECCAQLRARLMAQREKVLLRVLEAPDFERPREFTGAELVACAEDLAGSLVLPNERSVVLLLLPHSPELFLLQLGLVLKGHIPAILAWPTTRVDPDKYQRNLVHQFSHLPADLLITLPRLAQNLATALPYPTGGMKLKNEAAFEKMFPAGAVAERFERGASGLRSSKPAGNTLFLQFSGGTTGAQKAIVVTAEMLAVQLSQLRDALAFTAEDSVASWLPLYHDMGLIACYWMPLWHGASSVQMGAGDWIINPELLLKCVAKYRATFCWLPNFAFAYLSQRRESMKNIDTLESVRGWIDCSEPVRQKSLAQFANAFQDCGVRRENLQTSYAMAETVFAITQSTIGKELAVFPRAGVRPRNQAHTGLAFDLIDDVYVSSGMPLRDVGVRIVASDGLECCEAVPGEIYVRTPALFHGYWGADGFQTHSLRDGWQATGDFGFIAGGELYVIGRLKDIVIVGGNNIYPEDVEVAVNTLDGVYPGRVVAFGVEDQEYGTQSLAVVAEMKAEFCEDAASDLEAAIRKLVLTAIGTAPRHVAVVPPRWIVKSTAGKISRRETRERFLRERLAAA